MIHARWAMLGTLGFLTPELLAKYTGMQVDQPVWFKAGAPIFPEGGLDSLGSSNLVHTQPIPAIVACQFALMAAVEVCCVHGGPLCKGIHLHHPGEASDHLGLGDDPDTITEPKVKEITNGRLAMFSMFCYYVQAIATGEAPVESWVSHVADITQLAPSLVADPPAVNGYQPQPLRASAPHWVPSLGAPAHIWAAWRRSTDRTTSAPLESQTGECFDFAGTRFRGTPYEGESPPAAPGNAVPGLSGSPSEAVGQRLARTVGRKHVPRPHPTPGIAARDIVDSPSGAVGQRLARVLGRERVFVRRALGGKRRHSDASSSSSSTSDTSSSSHRRHKKHKKHRHTIVMLFVVTGVSQRFRPQGQWDVSPTLASTVAWDPRGHHQWDGFPTSPTPPSTFPPQPVHHEAYCAPGAEPKHRPFTTSVPYTRVLLTGPAGLAVTLNNHRAMSLLWTTCFLVHLGHAGCETLNALLACAHPSGYCALYTAGRPTPPRQRINPLLMNLFKAHQVQHAVVFFVFCHAWFGQWCPSTYPPPPTSKQQEPQRKAREERLRQPRATHKEQKVPHRAKKRGYGDKYTATHPHHKA